MPSCSLSNEKREYLIVHVLNQEHDAVTRRNVEFKTPSTLHRFQMKTVLFCSVFKTIPVHTNRFCIVFVSFSPVSYDLPLDSSTISFLATN